MPKMSQIIASNKNNNIDVNPLQDLFVPDEES